MNELQRIKLMREKLAKENDELEQRLNSINVKSCEEKNEEVKSNDDENTFSNLNSDRKNAFFEQFEDLSYSRSGDVMSSNETSRDINSSLNRDIELRNGFSSFNSRNMDYKVTDNFNHTNMKPFHSRRSNSLNLDNDNRKLELHTGTDKFWKHKKEKKIFSVL